jgi:hypothetical protein
MGGIGHLGANHLCAIRPCPQQNAQKDILQQVKENKETPKTEGAILETVSQ